MYDLPANLKYCKICLSEDNDVEAESGGLNTRHNTIHEITLDAAGNQYNYIDIYKMKDRIEGHSKDSVTIPLDETLIYKKNSNRFTTSSKPHRM